MRDRRPAAPPRHRTAAPEERSLTDPRFLGSFPRADQLLEPPLPEVACVGRSNVGKSTLINAVLGRRIAKVSGTPGKTRMMNVFHISGLGVGGPGPGTPDPGPLTPFYFLDLPGYGYARASQTERVAFRHLVEYALRRSRLTGAVWLLDLRHEPSADDRAIQDLLAAAGTRVLAVATKADKLPRRQRQRREGDLRETLQVDPEQFLVTSAKTGEGIVELREAIAGLIGREHEANG